MQYKTFILLVYLSFPKNVKNEKMKEKNKRVGLRLELDSARLSLARFIYKRAEFVHKIPSPT